MLLLLLLRPHCSLTHTKTHTHSRTGHCEFQMRLARAYGAYEQDVSIPLDSCRYKTYARTHKIGCKSITHRTGFTHWPQSMSDTGTQTRAHSERYYMRDQCAETFEHTHTHFWFLTPPSQPFTCFTHRHQWYQAPSAESACVCAHV